MALVDTWALCGFREPAEALDLVERLSASRPWSRWPRRSASADPDGTRAALGWVLQLDGRTRDDVAGAAAAAALGLRRRPAEPLRLGRPARRASTLATRAASARSCSTCCTSTPGERVHLPAGYLHAYLEGAGVELMAASDNVLRGGLTSKHIDVPELLRSLRFEPGLPDDPDPARRSTGRPVLRRRGGRVLAQPARPP